MTPDCISATKNPKCNHQLIPHLDNAVQTKYILPMTIDDTSGFDVVSTNPKPNLIGM